MLSASLAVAISANRAAAGLQPEHSSSSSSKDVQPGLGASSTHAESLLTSKGSTSHPPNLLKHLTTENKIFFLGADKTGTSTLQQLFYEMPGDWQPCHDICLPEGEKWFFANSTDAPIYKAHRAFMDNGDYSDFEWLEKNFHGGRFVLNQRALRDWMLSRYDMNLANRIQGGCTPVGTQGDCKTGKEVDGTPTNMVNNDLNSMRRWVSDVAASQANMKAYFDAQDLRRKRFVAIDLCNGDPEETKARLFWAARNDLNAFVPDKLMTADAQFPKATSDYFRSLASQSNVKLTHINARPHPTTSVRAVESFLKAHGCQEMSGHLWYLECWNHMAKVIAAEEAAAANSTAPVGAATAGASTVGANTHAKGHGAEPRGVERKRGEDAATSGGNAGWAVSGRQ